MEEPGNLVGVRKGQWQLALSALRNAEVKRRERDVIGFNAAINVCRKAKWQHAWGCFQEAQGSDMKLDVVTYSVTISAAAAAAQWQHASALLHELRGCQLQADVIVYSAVASACEKASEWQQALQLLDELEGVQLEIDVVMQNIVMAACGNAKQWTKALEILSLIETGNELDDVSLGSAMDACQNSSQWEVALLLLVDFKGSKLQTTAITQNATISSCGKAKEWTFALALLQDLRLDADVISYNSTISSCEKASEYQPAVWLFDELRVGLEATVVTYSAIISACEKASEWQTALHFLSESTSQRLSNLITFNAAISACEKSAEVNMALALVKQLQSFHLEGDVVTFSASIGACDRASKWQDALGLYFEAGRSHVEIGVVGCTSTINACEKVAQWHQALLVFPLHFDVTRVANASISACEKASRWQVALCLLDEVKFVEFLEPDVVTYSAIMSALQKALQWVLALHLLNHMKGLFVQPDAITIDALVSMCQLAQKDLIVQRQLLWPLGARMGRPAERPRMPEDSQVRNQQAAAASIAALLAEQEAARRLPTLSGDRGPPGDGDGTPPSQRELSFVVEGATSGQGFSAMPPAANAPDLLLQLAQAKAKVRHLELQLEDSEQRWQRRFEDAKRQEDASHARMELQCQYLQSELDRCKEVQASEMRHFLEQKRMLSQGHQTEKEEAVREERRKVQMEIDKVKADHRLEVEAELKRQNERAIAIVKQQADVEAENLRRAQTGEHHLTKLVEQVQGSVAEVERLSKRVDSDKTMEWSVRERQIEARERNARDMEAQLSRQSKEVEEQRRRLSDLVTNLQNCQEEDTSVLASERERLQAEHQRLLELQQSVREADRNNKEALKHAWAQVEEDRRVLQQEQLRFDSEQAARKEELEMQERQLKSETERLKTLHQQIEVARQSAARRIRETESTVANERRCLMNDLEAFEEKKRFHSSEAMKLENDRRQLQEDKSNFESELHSVGLMAQELERRSEEIRVLHGEAAEARSELHLLRGQLQEERSAQGTEMERLRTMQSLIEQQRLQLLQTENQLRLQGVEDIDLQVTGQGHFPNDLPSLGNAQEAMNRWTTDWLEPREVSGPIPGPATRRPVRNHRSLEWVAAEKDASRCVTKLLWFPDLRLQRSRKGSGEMQTYLLQSAAFLQEAQRAPPAIQARWVELLRVSSFHRWGVGIITDPQIRMIYERHILNPPELWVYLRAAAPAADPGRMVN
ncbi:unnamed protein product [Cladocopium goreaui]|uniref:Pentatricopeptide repeat-containing protein MRL1, chloroplastic (Protein MATURATION OF RBCL 1) (AtMRL1) n=1 Tax=Cladocopium goreaui TaxID=2562237 RepID=A0A9P1FYR5_9DINO|nr:unnamed protein product [Cladocopium goreaui]